ncbi:transcription antitermination protein NusG [Klebsiella pneumoniae]|nr:transcription antitermination protein NusG [Klebsiella pneumoniae]
MAKLTKRMRVIREKVDATKQYDINEAIALLKELATAKFTESVDVAVNLGIDARKSDQNVRGATVLPHGTGRSVRVATSLREHIKLHNMEELFGEVMVPTEEVVEIRGGQRRKSERKFFPGYVLVQMVMNDASWHLVRSVPRVMGFIGGTSDRPAPISDKEVDAIMNRLQQVGDKPRPKTLFEPGEMVRVNDGPFADFNGVVEEVDYEKSRLKVSVSIFGRATPVELDFSQVEKA